VIAARYDARVYAFEPDPTAFPRLCNQLARHPKATPLSYGLGAGDATRELALAGPGSSLYEVAGAFGTRSVEIRDVTAVVDTLAPTGVGVMKLNVEGAEYEVLERLIASGRLPRVRQLLVQFHEWHPKAYRRRRAIRRVLAQTHDEVWSYPWLWELWRLRPDGTP
jgi:FkbM family methyltransferase